MSPPHSSAARIGQNDYPRVSNARNRHGASPPGEKHHKSARAGILAGSTGSRGLTSALPPRHSCAHAVRRALGRAARPIAALWP